MLASALPDTLPAAGATPTQRALHEAAVARRQRLGLVRGFAPAPVVAPLREPVLRRALRVVAAPVLDATDHAIIAGLVAGDGPKAIAEGLGLGRERVKSRIYRKGLWALAAAQPVPVKALPTGPAPQRRAIAIVREVAARHRLADTALLRGTRVLAQVLARDEAIGTISAELGWSLTRIGKLFGGRHHTTILQALRRWQRQQTAPADLTPGERAIVDAVAARHGLVAREMLGCSRQRGMRAARAELCWRLHHEGGASLDRLVALLRGRDPKGAAFLVRWHERHGEVGR